MWVPGQDLATPHLMRNCRKHISLLHYTLYVRLCTRNMLYACWWPCVFTSGPRDMSTHIWSNPGNALVCLGLYVPISPAFDHLIAICKIFGSRQCMELKEGLIKRTPRNEAHTQVISWLLSRLWNSFSSKLNFYLLNWGICMYSSTCNTITVWHNL